MCAEFEIIFISAWLFCYYLRSRLQFTFLSPKEGQLNKAERGLDNIFLCVLVTWYVIPWQDNASVAFWRFLQIAQTRDICSVKKILCFWTSPLQDRQDIARSLSAAWKSISGAKDRQRSMAQKGFRLGLKNYYDYWEKNIQWQIEISASKITWTPF